MRANDFLIFYRRLEYRPTLHSIVWEGKNINVIEYSNQVYNYNMHNINRF